MQVSAINTNNFGNGYYTEMSRENIQDIEKVSQFLRNYSDSHALNQYDNEEQPQQKSFLGVAASIIVGGIGMFALAKKGLKSASSVLNNVKASEVAIKAAELAKNSKLTQKAGEITQKLQNKITNKIADNKVLSRITSIGKEVIVDNVAKLINKIGVENTVAGAASIGATAYVARTDGNGNGIPDIAEKGVNAYKNALSHIDAIKEVVDLVS